MWELCIRLLFGEPPLLHNVLHFQNSTRFLTFYFVYLNVLRGGSIFLRSLSAGILSASISHLSSYDRTAKLAGSLLRLLDPAFMLGPEGHFLTTGPVPQEFDVHFIK